MDNMEEWDVDAIEKLVEYFSIKGLINVKRQWFASKVAQGKVNGEEVFREWIEQDWNSALVKDNSYQSLPTAMLKNHYDIEKRVVRGTYLLQINSIVDISKPLPMGDNLPCDEEKNDDEEEYDENEIDPDDLFRRTNLNAGASKVPTHNNGPRMLQLSLWDGHQECLAIEYEPISFLHVGLHGAKLKLTGNLEISVGTVLLKPVNLQLISPSTFDVYGLAALSLNSRDNN